jgi:uncharacterized Zn-binding protein involved in type VI secretion
VTALAAARLADPVGHAFDWGGVGAAVGAALAGGLAMAAAAKIAIDGAIFAIGVGTMFAGPVGGALAGGAALTVGGLFVAEAGALGRWVGAKLGRPLAEWLSETLGLEFDVETGEILIGDPTVLIELQPASRSCIDFAACAYHPSPIPPSIITGSSTVFIGQHPAARVSDGGACRFYILAGARHVFIGGAQVTCECAALWAKYLAEAEAIIAPHDGDHRQRNRAISAAYARLYLRDRRFIWAGFAAYASKQVGCAMDHAQGAMKIGGGLATAGAVHVMTGPSGAVGGGLMAYGSAAALAADYTYEQLGKGNRELFLDVYPLHRFYEEHGAARMIECAGSRTPPAEPEALAAFAALDDEARPEQERRSESLARLAIHEQLNILQRQIYDDYMFRRILVMNETGAPLSSPAEVSLGADCSGKRTHKFSKDWMSDGRGGIPELYDETERMDWILDEVAKDYESFEGSTEHLEDLERIGGQAP